MMSVPEMHAMVHANMPSGLSYDEYDDLFRIRLEALRRSEWERWQDEINHGRADAARERWRDEQDRRGQIVPTIRNIDQERDACQFGLSKQAQYEEEAKKMRRLSSS
jgi:hypothetical protein